MDKAFLAFFLRISMKSKLKAADRKRLIEHFYGDLSFLLAAFLK